MARTDRRLAFPGSLALPILLVAVVMGRGTASFAQSGPPATLGQSGEPLRLVPRDPPQTAAGNVGGGSDRPIREGTELVDQIGTFTAQGDRLIFVMAAGRHRLIGLENLNLERIGRALTGNPNSVTWIVSGTVSEYRGSNYILVRRAMLKNRASAVTSAPPTVGSKKP